MKTPYVTARPVRNRYLVRVRDRRRARELAAVTVAVLTVGAALVAYTWLHAQQMAGGYRAEALERQLKELQRVERHLQLEEAYLASPQRVEERALEELGMRPPELPQLVFVSDAGAMR
ncbi:MAG TPA: cell division protein FtsL [Thermoanaerobaculia bacterium]|nr:cell division protein FtsL [Thermoanaerobaculia bacterium]